MLLCNNQRIFFFLASRSLWTEAKTYLGYFRRGGLDLSFNGAVVNDLLVTAGTRVRGGFGALVSPCDCGCMGMGVAVCACVGMGVGFADADALGAGCGAEVVLVLAVVVVLSRPRVKAIFASRLLVALVGREDWEGDALFGCVRSDAW